MCVRWCGGAVYWVGVGVGVGPEYGALQRVLCPALPADLRRRAAHRVPQGAPPRRVRLGPISPRHHHHHHQLQPVRSCAHWRTMASLVDYVARSGLFLFAQVPDKVGYSLYLRPVCIGTTPTLGVTAADQALLYAVGSPVGPYFKVFPDFRPPTCIQRVNSLYLDSCTCPCTPSHR